MSKPLRKQPTRQVQIQAAASASNNLDPEISSKRTKRRLEDLERSNYTEPRYGGPNEFSTDNDEEGAGKGKHRARDTFNLNNDGKKKKKSTAAVRQVLLYRKTFNTLLEEADLAKESGPNYLTAVAPPPKHPPRQLCAVCGYFSAYKCRKCAMSYCTIQCQATHDETGCERRSMP